MYERQLSGRKYMFGDTFTAVDVVVGYALCVAKRKRNLLDDFPTLSEYAERMEKRPALKKAVL
jgi:glutathione S-transferase